MTLEPLPASARRLAPITSVAAVLALLALSHWDRLYMYGDDVNKLSPGRAFPLPELGNYIGSRVVDNYFIGFLFEVFRMVVGPLFGLHHVVDVHSAFATTLYAVSGAAVLGALFLFTRLFVDLGARHFVPFALCANVLVLDRIKMMAVTGIGSFQVPLALSLWLLYPVVTWAVTGRDVLARWAPARSASALALLVYGVAFSVTNVAYFTAAVVTACAVWRLARGADGERPPSVPARFALWPTWFRLVAVALPVMALVATYYDVTSGRYTDEQRQEFRTEGFEGLSLFDGLKSLPLSGGAVLDGVTLIALLCGAFLVARASLRRPVVVGARLVALGAVLAPAFVLYTAFLLKISNLGGKDYFAHPGMNAYHSFALGIAVLASAFALLRGRAAVLGTALLALLGVHGVRQLAEVPTRDVTKAEVRGIFDSLYMCYSHGEERVPVFLRHAPLGWPYGASEAGWYLDAYRRALREHVLGYGAHVPEGYEPVFHRVESVDALHAELDRMRASKPLLVLDLEDSPYFIDTRARQGR